jgi:hypothetical protein
LILLPKVHCNVGERYQIVKTPLNHGKHHIKEVCLKGFGKQPVNNPSASKTSSFLTDKIIDL